MRTLSSRLNKHLAIAATVATGAAAVANAAIVYSGVVNINIPSSTSGVYLNVANGATSGSSSLAGWDLNPWSGSALNFFSSTSSGQTQATGMVGAGTVASNLIAGTMIDGSSVFTTNVGTQTTSGLNLNSSNNIFGFKFYHEGAAAYRFGWVRISLGATAGGQPRSIVEYAYENSGAGIGAGDTGVPAPGALALLGLAGLTGRRRRA